MVKRKFLMSIIITLVAAITLVSGTYAWFLVGGFGSLFDIGFNVMEAGAGLELQGSAMTGWKSKLEREDFVENSFVDKDNGTYSPISSATGVTGEFVKIGLEGDKFGTAGTVTAGKDYNDFYLFIRSTDQKPQDIGMTVKISGEGGTKAGRVSVTYNGTTTIYAYTGENTTEAVTNAVAKGSITDTNGDRIISSADDNYSAAGLTNQPFTTVNESGYLSETTQITLADCGGSADGSRVDVRVWIEGNDSDCVDFAERTIAGKEFKVEIGFTTIG